MTALRRRHRAPRALRLLAASLLIFAIGAPLLAADQARLTVLPNGLRVLTQEVRTAPVVAVYTWYRAGSRNEHPGITGISHFVEHMLFRGTKHFGPGEVSRLITRTGGRDNGFTWLDYTAYLEVLPAEHLDLALRIEADRMVNATFDPDAVRAEKTVVLSELEGDENNPAFHLNTEVWAASFTAHPYQWRTIGWKSDVEAFNRQSALAYYRTHYVPNNCTLVVVGDFDTEPTLARIRELFAPIPQGPTPPQVVTVEPPQRGERRVMVRRPGAAGMLQIAFKVPRATHPDHFALDVVEIVLGAGRASRLHQALVETGRAVSADAYNFTNRDPTLFNLYITLTEGAAHEQVERAALAEIERLASELITERELQRAKNQARAAFIYGSDSVSRLAYRLGFLDVIANFRLLYRYLERIEEVTPERVREVVQRYLTEDNRTVGWFVPTTAAPFMPAAPIGPRSRDGGEALAPPVGEPAASPAVEARARPAATAAPQRIQLDNGATFIIYPNPAVPAVAMRGMVGAGSIFDPAGRRGLAAFTAQMLSRGAGERSAQEIAETLEFVAAEVDVGPGIQVANLSGRCLKDDLALVMEILADQVRRPTFPEEQIALARARTEVALREALQDTREVGLRAAYAALYPEDHPLRHPPLGTLAGIAAITRDDLVDFHGRHYRPDTLAVAIVGDVEVEQVRELAQRYFGDWRAQGERPPIVIPPAELPADGVRRAVAIPGKAQADIVIGLPGLSRLDPDYPAAELLNYVLGGGGLSSRLAERIRDAEGLAYYVYSYFAAYRDPGPWVMNMGVNPVRVEQAIASALEVMQAIRAHPPGAAELSLWQDYVAGSAALRLETNGGIAAALADAEFYGLGLDYPWRYADLMQAVTPAQVAAAAEKYIRPDRAAIAVAGPGGGTE